MLLENLYKNIYKFKISKITVFKVKNKNTFGLELKYGTPDELTSTIIIIIFFHLCMKIVLFYRYKYALSDMYKTGADLKGRGGKRIPLGLNFFVKCIFLLEKFSLVL